MAFAEITNTGSDASWGSITNTQCRGNTYTPASSFSVTAIKVKLYRSASNTGTVTCSITGTTAGVPSGAVLGTATIAAATITTDSAGAVYTLTFGTPVAVSSGTMYAFYLSHNDADGSLYVRYGADNYAGGTSLYFNGSTWSAGSSYDYYFIIYSSGVVEVALAVTGTSNVAIAAGISGEMVTIAMTVAGVSSITLTAQSTVSSVMGTRAYVIAFGYNKVFYG